MTTRKRNEYLDLPSDEEDGSVGYDSEDISNSKVLHGAKRRRTAAPERGSEDEDDDDVVSVDGEDLDAPVDLDEEDPESQSEEEDGSKPPSQSKRSKTKPPSKDRAALSNLKPKPDLTTLARRAASAQSKSLKTGVCYLSRIPPFLKPSALRSLLTPYAPHGLNRLFLTPEDPVLHKQRVKSGGNKKKHFTDGWVEFHSKRDAKIAAETLNTQIIGGKKGGWYHDDVWNIKYLKGFKWRHLTEQINSENAERSARMRVEIARTTRENKAFVANVERAKREEGMRETRRKRGEVEGEGDSQKRPTTSDVEADGGGTKHPGKEKKERPQKFNFRQNEVKGTTGISGAAKEPSADVKRVLSKIF